VEARWIACAVLLAAAGAAPAQEYGDPARRKGVAAEAGHAEFEAFGRHFSMELESNERALALIAFNHRRCSNNCPSIGAPPRQ
jgi:hypothetical protein